MSELIATLRAKQTEFADIVKIGRTHMMDAVPLTLGQVASMAALIPFSVYSSEGHRSFRVTWRSSSLRYAASKPLRRVSLNLPLVDQLWARD